MAKDYILTKAFRATVSKTDKTQKTWSNEHGTFYIWKATVAEYPGQYFQLNKKKSEDEFKEGDTVYGDFKESKWADGKPRLDFKRAQKPFSNEADAAKIKELEAKLAAMQNSNDIPVDNEPVDFSTIDF